MQFLEIRDLALEMTKYQGNGPKLQKGAHTETTRLDEKVLKTDLPLNLAKVARQALFHKYEGVLPIDSRSANLLLPPFIRDKIGFSDIITMSLAPFFKVGSNSSSNISKDIVLFLLSFDNSSL
jgi:hypothetical protein